MGDYYKIFFHFSVFENVCKKMLGGKPLPGASHCSLSGHSTWDRAGVSSKSRFSQELGICRSLPEDHPGPQARGQK